METLSLTPTEAETLLAARALALAENSARSVLGLAGGPGAGKSTLAVRLVERLNAATPGVAAYVPMDGFHMRHKKLEALGTAHEKGMPHTFEGAAFAQFLARLKAAREPVSGPSYSRRIEDVVDDAFTVPADARLLVVEGNYLLVGDPPWQAVRPLLDFAVFIDVPRETVRARLLRRHAEEGLFTEERNREHIERVDLANYDLVSRTRARADLVLALTSPT
jgi:pantothenate kinase